MSGLVFAALSCLKALAFAGVPALPGEEVMGASWAQGGPALSPGGVVSRRAFCWRCRSAQGGQGQLLAGPSGVWHGLDLCLSLQALAPFPRQEFRNLLLEAESNLELKHRNR